jgi:HTH-type transcriptional regulator/antitoxin HigA
MEMSIMQAPPIESIAAAARLDVPRYTELLGRFAPKVIETEKENRVAVRLLEELVTAAGERSREELALMDLLASLVDQFERRHYPVEKPEPRALLQYLLEHNHLKPADIADLMGGRSRVSDVLAGKREISKEQAKKLGERFRISPAAFI